MSKDDYQEDDSFKFLSFLGYVPINELEGLEETYKKKGFGTEPFNILNIYVTLRKLKELPIEQRQAVIDKNDSYLPPKILQFLKEDLLKEDFNIMDLLFDYDAKLKSYERKNPPQKRSNPLQRRYNPDSSREDGGR